jgi:predicted nucleic acid binding AN1-type Zn finger protein
MEFFYVGSRCFKQDCRQQDFLPFLCDLCGNKFCLEHKNAKDHDCTHINKRIDFFAQVCPKCHQSIQKSSSIQTHLDENCPNESTVPQKFKCFAPRCDQKEFTQFICKKCLKNFCVKHRNPHDHRCSS